MCSCQEFHQNLSEDLHKSFQENNKKLDALMERLDQKFDLLIQAFNGGKRVLTGECFDSDRRFVVEEQHLFD